MANDSALSEVPGTSVSSDSKRVRSLLRWTAFSCIVLIAATWRLWIPQTVFPQVPAFSFLCSTPSWIDWTALSVLIVGLGLLTVGMSNRSVICGGCLVLVSLATLISLDQHRFQAWVYHLMLFAFIGMTCKDNLARTLMTWLVISVYFYSALGKLDYEFINSVGQQMLGALTDLFGYDATEISEPVRTILVASFPLTELLVAVGLSWSKTRRLAGCLAIAVHVLLILILGPLGLNHRPGVLLWNTQFCVQAYLLFIVNPKSSPEKAASSVQERDGRFVWFQKCAQAACVVILGFAMVLPCTERFGIWDHWPSWALYAPHSSRVRVEITSSSISKLPPELGELMKHSASEEPGMVDWVVVPIEAWSLQSLHTPIYPQSRFQLGVAKHIAKQLDSEFEVRATVLGPAQRLTGQRHTQVLESASQINAAGAKFRFNSNPRSP